jgi:hypothetical protein
VRKAIRELLVQAERAILLTKQCLLSAMANLDELALADKRFMDLEDGTAALKMREVPFVTVL